MTRAIVLDSRGVELSPCPGEKARRLLAQGEADLVSESPLIVRLHRAVALPAPPSPANNPLDGARVLLHICCAPCATYTVRRLSEQGAQVAGYWYNPNIHPYSEHEKRRETLAAYAEGIDLPMIWEPGYDMPAYFQVVSGTPHFRERCVGCYRMRLAHTAERAAAEGFDAFTTTLLISPYQDMDAIRRLGDELAAVHGVTFYFENLRKGFAEHHRLAAEAGLYRQRYCGCIYSEWEGLDRGGVAYAGLGGIAQAGRDTTSPVRPAAPSP